MLFDLIKGDTNYTATIAYIIASLLVIFVTMPCHEFAHAFVATKLGDRTARYQGRLTLNPLAHIDYLGALGIILFGLGWARPVPVNPNAFKNPRKGMALTALAGPVMNLILAFVGSFFSYAFMYFYLVSDSVALAYISMFFSAFSSLNIGLAVFNLLPIPPLDGWKIMGIFLPAKTYWKIMSYERYISFGLILIICTGILDAPLFAARTLVAYVIDFLPSLIFGFGIG